MSVAEIKFGYEIYYMVSLHDITETANLRERLTTASPIDDLTGLYSKQGLLTLGDYNLKMADRMKKGMIFLMVDLDNLDRIREIKGQDEANNALIETADILRETFRQSDIVCRISDNKFVAIAIGASKGTENIIIGRLQKNIKLFDAKGRRQYKLLLNSVIIYYDPNNPCTVDELLNRADIMLIGRKKEG